MTPSALPLAGIRVVDLTSNVAGPFAAMILADLGAEVLKIEPPQGDDARRMAPAVDGTSAFFAACNRNKGSVIADLTTEQGRATVHALLEDADVFLTSLRARSLEARGLDGPTLAARHPRLVHTSVSAYGSIGPERHRSGYDAVVQARSGVMGTNGDPAQPPVRVGVSILDVTSGIWAALGTLAALARRTAGGGGGRVDTSLLEVGATFLSYHLMALQLSGSVPARSGSEHPAFAPYGLFRTGAGDLMIGVGGDGAFARLAGVLGAPEWADDPRFATNPDRVANAAALRALIEERLADRPAVDWEIAIAAVDVAASRVAGVADVLDDPQLAALGALLPLPEPGPAGQPLVVPGLPLTFDGDRPPIRVGPPTLGDHAAAWAPRPPAEPQTTTDDDKESAPWA